MFTDQSSSPLACPGASEVTPLRQRAARTLCLIAPLLLFGASAGHATGDAAAGQKLFAKCAACHSTAAGENKIGPSLADVVGRKSGTEPGYSYSAAMKSANITWDDAALDKFLTSPGGFVHGTKMFLSLPSSTDRQNVIAYLDTLK
jgi:cytochrome c2